MKHKFVMFLFVRSVVFCFVGYIGKVSFLEKVGQTIAEMKQSNPDLMFGEY